MEYHRVLTRVVVALVAMDGDEVSVAAQEVLSEQQDSELMDWFQSVLLAAASAPAQLFASAVHCGSHLCPPSKLHPACR